MLWDLARSRPRLPQSAPLWRRGRTSLQPTNSSPRSRPDNPETFLRKSGASPHEAGSPRPRSGGARAREPRGRRGGRGRPGRGAHVVSGRGTCGSDLRLRERSTAPRGRRDPQRLRARGAQGRAGQSWGAEGKVPGARGPAKEKPGCRRCLSHCSSRGRTQEGRHKFEWGGNLD